MVQSTFTGLGGEESGWEWRYIVRGVDWADRLSLIHPKSTICCQLRWLIPLCWHVRRKEHAGNTSGCRQLPRWWVEYDRVDGGRDCGNNVSRLLQTPPNFLYFCIGCFVISPELFLLQSAIILRSSSASDNFIEHTFFTMFSPFYSEISAQTASCGLREYHIIG